MSNKDKTYIYVLTDRSGSMDSIRNDVIGGFNSFLQDQQKETNECVMTYAQFDHSYQEVFVGKDIQSVEPLTSKTFVPRGTTALLDAWYRSITNLRETIKAQSEEDRPGKVIFVVITDGYENASREVNKKQLFDMVETAKEDNWMFTFIAADQDAIAVAKQYGINQDSALTFHKSGKGVSETYKSLSKVVRGVRTLGLDNISYSSDDRSKSIEK